MVSGSVGEWVVRESACNETSVVKFDFESGFDRIKSTEIERID